MFSKINHVAIVCENYSQLAHFYPRRVRHEEVGQEPTGARDHRGRWLCRTEHQSAARGPLRRASIISAFKSRTWRRCFSRMRAHYPSVKWLQRPSTRPLAGLTTHDPDGNVFDLSQKEMKNRTSLYAEEGWQQVYPHYISHIALRTMNAEGHGAVLFRRVRFLTSNAQQGRRRRQELLRLRRPHHQIELMQWDIIEDNGAGVSVIMPGMDHLGFKGRKHRGVQGRRRAHRRRQSAAGAGAGAAPARKARRSTSCSRAPAPWASTGSPIPTAS